uniref:Uncharacterized protein n=1 Tax=Brassica oleracea var. oleracea TaxID=109376 RepID=A0A0D3BGJ0_BRAOL
GFPFSFASSSPSPFAYSSSERAFTSFSPSGGSSSESSWSWLELSFSPSGVSCSSSEPSFTSSPEAVFSFTSSPEAVSLPSIHPSSLLSIQQPPPPSFHSPPSSSSPHFLRSLSLQTSLSDPLPPWDSPSFYPVAFRPPSQSEDFTGFYLRFSPNQARFWKLGFFFRSWPFSYHCLCPRVSSLCFPFSRAWDRDASQMRERSGGGGGMRRRRRFLTEGEVLMGRGRDEGSGGAWSSLTFSTTLWSPLTCNRTRSRRRLLSTLEHHRRVSPHQSAVLCRY